MAIVYFLCGLASSGKTTAAKKIEAEQGAVRFTLDQRMREKYSYTIFDDEYGSLATQEKELIWQEAQSILQKGQDVILDWSLWSRQSRIEWPQRVIAAGYDYKLIYLDISLDELRQRLTDRNANRPSGVHEIPLEELERFSKIFEPPSTDEGLNLEIISVEKASIKHIGEKHS